MTVATSNKPLKLDLPVVLFMVIVHGGALFALLPSNFSWAAVGIAVFLHWVTGGLGITLGFHRLITHRSFQTPKLIEYFLVLCGTLSCQGGVTEWVGMHRFHHLHSDQDQDPHDSKRGFWWSHMGWMLFDIPMRDQVPRFTKDINDDPVYQFFNKYFIPLQIALAGVLYAIGGWPFVVWGVFVRLIAVFHCTWLVNSATHMFGYQSHESNDNSRNCWWVALLTYGEGWHNNHHAYQHSARHGLQWWEIDMTWMTIQFLQALGLASKVKLASKD
ncbi:acyl-CoA desaturase [Leptolyngbyaceae cyanobacterium UHCC 1019]